MKKTNESNEKWFPEQYENLHELPRQFNDDTTKCRDDVSSLKRKNKNFKSEMKDTKFNEGKNSERKKNHSTNIKTCEKVKKKMVQENSRKRNERMIESKRRRQQLEKDRVTQSHLNSGKNRQERIKRRADKQKKADSIKVWLYMISLVSGVQACVETLQDYRQHKQRCEIENKAAMIIQRQMRWYRFRQYRKRLRRAFSVISLLFLAKVKLWKKSRRRLASDRIRDFLVALEQENHKSGGSLALIVKGKKWRAYRFNIIFLQRVWRKRLSIMTAQMLLIDRQWQREQNKQTNLLVDDIYRKREAEVLCENEQIEGLNRTRKLIKLKSLPKIKSESRESIQAKLMDGHDILSLNNIVPDEIRHGIIKDCIKLMKYLFAQDLKQYEIESKRFLELERQDERRDCHLMMFSGSSFTTKSFIRAECSSSNEQVDANIRRLPTKPRFRILLSTNALQELMKLGDLHVKALRKAWEPTSKMIGLIPYNGRTVADLHHQECQDLTICSIKSNTS